jgi:hypothetical protein
MRRSPITRHTALRRGKPVRKRRATPRRSSRVRNREYMIFVKTLLCCIEEHSPDPHYHDDPCDPVIEADHVGRRGIGQKCSDDETIPLCARHHRERHNARGIFSDLAREQMREWLDAQIRRTQTLWAEHNGHDSDA